MAAESGGSRVVAAIVLGVALVIGAWIIGTATDRQAVQIGAVAAAVDKLEEAIGAAGGPPGRPRVEGPARPDPDKRHVIDIGDAPIRGGKDAQVSIVEFSDFQCPFCARVNPTLAQINQTYGDKARVVFKHLPLRIHPDAPGAAAAAEAAHSSFCWAEVTSIKQDIVQCSDKIVRDIGEREALPDKGIPIITQRISTFQRKGTGQLFVFEPFCDSQVLKFNIIVFQPLCTLFLHIDKVKHVQVAYDGDTTSQA